MKCEWCSREVEPFTAYHIYGPSVSSSFCGALHAQLWLRCKASLVKEEIRERFPFAGTRT